MKPPIVFADLSLQFEDVRGAVRSTGEVIDVEFDSIKGFAAARRTLRSVASWRSLGRGFVHCGLTIRLSVGEVLIAEAGRQTGGRGVSVGIGSGWRVWPLHIAKTLIFGGKKKR
jgi:hypothetical protein